MVTARVLTRCSYVQPYNPDTRMKPAKVLVIDRDAVATMLDHMAALADPLRCRMLLALERHELTVSELCAVLQLPQSTVSRHLKTLADAGWVTLAPRRHEPLLQHVARRSRRRRAPALAADPRAGGRHQRAPIRTSGACKSVLARRRSKSRRVLLVARRGSGIACARSCSAARSTCTRCSRLLDPTLVVGDLGCGTGQLSGAARAARRARHRRRRLGRHAAGGAARG